MDCLHGKCCRFVQFTQYSGIFFVQQVVDARMIQRACAAADGFGRCRVQASGQRLQAALPRGGVVVKLEQLCGRPGTQLLPAGKEAAQQLAVRQARRKGAVGFQVGRAQPIENQHNIYVA